VSVGVIPDQNCADRSRERLQERRAVDANAHGVGVNQPDWRARWRRCRDVKAGFEVDGFIARIDSGEID
jgi:hypothetical protein